MNHHRRGLTALAGVLLAASAAFGGELAGKSVALLEVREAERDGLEAGQTGLNGYALFGDRPPKALLTGDDYLDQRYSRAARVRMLRQEIDGLRRIGMTVVAAGAGRDAKTYVPRLGKLRGPKLLAALAGLSGAPRAEEDDVFVLGLHLAGLHRFPDAAALREDVAALDGGKSRLDLIRALLGSTEYKRRRTTNRQFVRDAFQLAAGREPTRAEASKAASALDGGAKRLSVLPGGEDLGAKGATPKPAPRPDADPEGPDDQSGADDGKQIDLRRVSDDDRGTPAKVRKGKRLFREDFDGKLSGWKTHELDDVEVDDGKLTYEIDDEEGYLAYGRAVPMDGVEIAFRGRCDKPGFLVLLRAADGSVVGADLGGPKNERLRLFGGEASRPIAQVRGAVFRKKAWCVYRIRIAGRRIEVSVDGKRLGGAPLTARGGSGVLTISGGEDDYGIDWITVRRLAAE